MGFYLVSLSVCCCLTLLRCVFYFVGRISWICCLGTRVLGLLIGSLYCCYFGSGLICLIFSGLVLVIVRVGVKSAWCFMVVLCLDTCDLCFCRYYFALFIGFWVWVWV